MSDKPVIKTATLKPSCLTCCDIATFTMVIVLMSLVWAQSALATEHMRKRTFSEDVGYKKTNENSYYTTAKLAYDTQEYVYSSRIFDILASQGHVQAQYLLASQYDVGLGVDVDKMKSFILYQQAARGGVLAAQYNLAVAYAKGQGTQVNLAKAIYWWKSAAKKGNTDAQFNLGTIYASGFGSIEPNLKKALKWWRMASMSGDAIAQFNLGVLYANGIGLSSRTCEASRWWKKSAANGFSQAKLALALLETKKDYATCR